MIYLMEAALNVEIVNNYSEQALKDILSLEKESFPSHLVYDDGEEYYKLALGNPNNIHIFLKDKDKRVGYLMAMPHNVAAAELLDNDPDMALRDGQYYVETLQILPGARGGFGLLLIIRELERQLMKRSVYRISFHARKLTKITRVTRKVFQNTKVLRSVDNWLNSTESVEYVEIDMTSRQRSKGKGSDPSAWCCKD